MQRMNPRDIISNYANSLLLNSTIDENVNENENNKNELLLLNEATINKIICKMHFSKKLRTEKPEAFKMKQNLIIKNLKTKLRHSDYLFLNCVMDDNETNLSTKENKLLTLIHSKYNSTHKISKFDPTMLRPCSKTQPNSVHTCIQDTLQNRDRKNDESGFIPCQTTSKQLMQLSMSKQTSNICKQKTWTVMCRGLTNRTPA